MGRVHASHIESVQLEPHQGGCGASVSGGPSTKYFLIVQEITTLEEILKLSDKSDTTFDRGANGPLPPAPSYKATESGQCY